MASSHVGGLSGAFIPVSEDAGTIDAVSVAVSSLDKLGGYDMRMFCWPDMIAIPGDTTSGIQFLQLLLMNLLLV